MLLGSQGDQLIEKAGANRKNWAQSQNTCASSRLQCRPPRAQDQGTTTAFTSRDPGPATPQGGSTRNTPRTYYNRNLCNLTAHAHLDK